MRSRNEQFPPLGPPAHPGAGRRLCRPIRGDGRLRLRGGEDQAEQRQDEEHQERRRHHRQNRRWRRNDAKAGAGRDRAERGEAANSAASPRAGVRPAGSRHHSSLTPMSSHRTRGALSFPASTAPATLRTRCRSRGRTSGEYLVTFADNDAANAVITSAGDNAVTAVTKTADGFVVKVWNNSDAAFVDGKSFSLVAF